MPYLPDTEISEKNFIKGVGDCARKTLLHMPELDLDIEEIKLSVLVDHGFMVIVIPLRLEVAESVQFIKSYSVKS